MQPGTLGRFRATSRAGLAILLLLTGCAASAPAAATPQHESRSLWKPTPEKPINLHWQLSDPFIFPRDVVPSAQVYDIDGELTGADTVARLHALDPRIRVICYMDAGVYESYRPDAGRFPKSVIGKPDTGWSNSYWLDIRRLDVIMPILRDRMQHWCKDKGFDAVEPDETAVWSNDSGFQITKEQNGRFNRGVAALAHSLGLSVGLKGNASESPELWPSFDWTLNEQCWEYHECDLLRDSFVAHEKAVFNVEYSAAPDCKLANAWHINSIRRDLPLVGPTNPAYRLFSCMPASLTVWP